MRVEYRQVDDLGDVVRGLTELGSRTVIFDVEPLIALWDTGKDVLREGVDPAIAEILSVKDIEVIGFATNSMRHLEIHPDHDGVQGLLHIPSSQTVRDPTSSPPSPPPESWSETRSPLTACWPGASASLSPTSSIPALTAPGARGSCTTSVGH